MDLLTYMTQRSRKFLYVSHVTILHRHGSTSEQKIRRPDAAPWKRSDNMVYLMPIDAQSLHALYTMNSVCKRLRVEWHLSMDIFRLWINHYCSHQKSKSSWPDLTKAILCLTTFSSLKTAHIHMVLHMSIYLFKSSIILVSILDSDVYIFDFIADIVKY